MLPEREKRPYTKQDGLNEKDRLTFSVAGLSAIR
jgi:hypothetical protein